LQGLAPVLTLKEAAIPQPGSNNHLEEGDEEKRSAQSIALKEKRHQKSHSCKNKSPRSCKEKKKKKKIIKKKKIKKNKTKNKGGNEDGEDGEVEDKKTAKKNRKL
jgi:hypothetical protein